MRVVLDTNILVSALIAPAGNPAVIYNAREQSNFTLLTCTEHLDEVRATLQKPRVANLVRPYKAGRLVNSGTFRMRSHVFTLHPTTKIFRQSFCLQKHCCKGGTSKRYPAWLGRRRPPGSNPGAPTTNLLN
jgi:predicted nucleic acid-binding protein